MPEIRNIVKYNALDCLAVYQIIDYLRKNNGYICEESEVSETSEESEVSEMSEESTITDYSETSDNSHEPLPKKRNIQSQSPLIVRPIV